MSEADQVAKWTISPYAFLAGGGETGALIAARDWSLTPLGPIEAWPQSLRTATAILLRSPVPIVMLWGSDGVMLYNDAYSVFAGGRHPDLLGSKVREGWPEVADFNDHVMKVGLAGGTLAYKDQELTLYRHGAPEQVWMNLDYSPVLDETGTPAGVLAIVVETTERVLADRRRSIMLELEEQLRRLDDPADAIAAAQEALGRYLCAGRVGYGEVDASGRYFTTERNWTDGAVDPQHGTHDLAAFGPEVLTVLQRGATLVVSDVAADPRTNAPDRQAAFAALDVAAVITVTLVKDGRLRAALYVHSPTPRVWSKVDVALVEEVAERTWDAVERMRAETAVRRSEARLGAMLESVSDCFYAVDVDWRLTVFNRASELYFGVKRDQVLGAKLWDLFPQGLGTDYERLCRAAMDEHQSAAIEMRSVLRPDRVVELRVVPKAGGGIAVTISDITDRKQAEARLRESEARLRTLTNALPAFVWFTGADGELNYFNDRWYEYTGQTPEEALSNGWAEAVHPDDIDRTLERWADARARGGTYEVELRYRHREGDYRWYVARAEPLRDIGGDITAWVGTSTDISQAKRLQEHQQLLINELNHRVKNTLAIVQGIAQQTFRDAAADPRHAFEGRLSALSAAHNILTRQSWESASLAEIVAQAIEPYRDRAGVFEIAGPDLALQPKTAVSLALALHELATNAVKYGALSTPAGRVELRWQVDAGRLRLMWCERGGPPVVPPTRRGFGSRMIERGLAVELGGEVKIDFERQGLVCTIDAPLPVVGA